MGSTIVVVDCLADFNRYFGRAKELPGVREMFNKGGTYLPLPFRFEADLAAKAATEESARNASFQKFRNQGTEYYGDNDELDGDLLAEEDELARKGTNTSLFHHRLYADTVRLGRSRRSNR